MFEWLRRIYSPKQRELDKLRRDNKLLLEEIDYEERRRALAELNLELAEFKIAYLQQKKENGRNDHI